MRASGLGCLLHLLLDVAIHLDKPATRKKKDQLLRLTLRPRARADEGGVPLANLCHAREVKLLPVERQLSLVALECEEGIRCL